MTSDLPLCPPWDANPHPPRFSMPDGAYDTHVHVFGPESDFPYQSNRAYTPRDASVEQLFQLHDVLGFKKVVLVQASAHGVDNRAILAGVAKSPERIRAIAAVGEDVTDAELRRLHEGGVRGIRLNLVDKGGMPFSSLGALRVIGERIKDMGWHIEFLVHVEADEEFRRLVPTLPVPVSVGHIGYTKAPAGIDHPGYRDFLAMLRDGHFWVKLTGPYRISAADNFPYPDVTEKAHAVIAAAPDRCVWGSDWPHVIHFRGMPNDGDLLDALADWCPDEEIRRRILVDNPARLYGF